MSREKITKAIVIRATNYQESDKILTLFSLEEGKITASLRGCRKPNAKLKFAGQLLCFAEFSLVQRGNNFVITNASELESFFDISKDYTKLQTATAMLEVSDVVLNAGEPNPSFFVQNLKGLKTLCFTDTSPSLVLIKFLTETLAMAGYQIQTNACQGCGGQFHTHIFMDLDSGQVVCGLCRGINCLELSLPELATLKMIVGTDYSRLHTVRAKPNIAQSLISILKTNWNARFQQELKSLKSF